MNVKEAIKELNYVFVGDNKVELYDDEVKYITTIDIEDNQDGTTLLSGIVQYDMSYKDAAERVCTHYNLPYPYMKVELKDACICYEVLVNTEGTKLVRIYDVLQKIKEIPAMLETFKTFHIVVKEFNKTLVAYNW